MNLNFDAETLTPLATENAFAEIERILVSLRPDFLGDRVIEEAVPDNPERRVLDLTVEGSVGNLLREALKRCDVRWAHEKKLVKAGRIPPNPAPSRRRFARVSFVTGDGRRNLHLHVDEFRLQPMVVGRPANKLYTMHFTNYVSLDWEERKLRGEPLVAACRSICTRLFDNRLFDYGRCCLRDEYWDKTMVFTAPGEPDFSLDVTRWLPGFYWGNYFGRFLRERIGEDVLLSVPGCTSQRLGAGIFVTNELPPDQWQDPKYIENTNRAMDHIGRDLFFEKGKEPTGTLFPVEGYRGLAESRDA